MGKEKTEELLIEAKNFFNTYKREIGESIKEGKNVVYLDFEKLSEFSPILSEKLISSPEEMSQLLELSLDEGSLVKNPRVRFTNLPASLEVRIRNIRSKHLNNFLFFDGIIRQASEVRPQAVSAKFECPSCGTIISMLQLEKKFREPSRCSCGRKGFFKLISKDMVDAQRLIVEESPDSLIGGEQPRRINVFLKEDLVEPRMEEKTTPGSKVRVIGILKEVPVPLQTGGISTRYDLSIDANNVIPLEENFNDLKISDEDERQILELAQDPHVFNTIASNIAPSIYGHNEIKKALTLQLFGGVKKVYENGTTKRGDIHVLLIGDPGVAKSQMLKFISGIAPKGRYVVGKSATGAGLTATVVRDEYLKGWSLEAGAMVLAHKGMVCIDEIEKMNPEDRSSMHEAMEQQTVTISKANVQATLRAEASVLAAGNPKFGRFDPYQPIAQQIDLPPTLLNRFDFIFTIKDMPDEKTDRAIASHVLQEHKEGSKELLVDKELLRKYTAYSKQKIIPKLTDGAIKEIEDFYVALRNKPVSTDSLTRPIPISARQLEALVRMAEASARIRLSEKVEKHDALTAIEMMKFCLMQVGYDYESNSFDIDRITTGFSSSQRGKILLVKDTLQKMESKLGKLLPLEEVEKEVEGNISKAELDEILQKLTTSGDLFHPRKGYVQLM